MDQLEQRVANIEKTTQHISVELASVKSMLGERCVVREAALADLKKRVEVLEVDYQRRKGQMAACMALLTVASFVGSFLGKILL